MSDTRNEIVNELGFGIVPNLFAAAEANPEVQTGLWKAFRHIVLRAFYRVQSKR